MHLAHVKEPTATSSCPWQISLEKATVVGQHKNTNMQGKKTRVALYYSDALSSVGEQPEFHVENIHCG